MHIFFQAIVNMESPKMFPPLSWLGFVFFLLGMAINVQSDSVLRRLLLLMMMNLIVMMVVMMSTMMLMATICTLTQSWPACEVRGRPATRSHTAVSFAFCRRPTTSERPWSGAALRPLHRWLFICLVVCWLHVLFGNQLFMAYPCGANNSERKLPLKNPGSVFWHV